MIKKIILTVVLGTSLFFLWNGCDKPVDTDANQAPRCRDTTLSVEETKPLKVSLTAADPDGDYLDWSITEIPKCGSVDKLHGTIGSGEEFTYTSRNFVSSMKDTFTIRITDFMIDKSIQVFVNISAENEKPYIPNLDTIRVVRGQDFPIDVQGVDPEGQPVTWEVVTNPSNGTLVKVRDTISTATEATYNGTSGTDSFEYRVSDGLLTSDPGTAYLSNFDALVLQQGKDGYTGCKDVSIGKIGHEERGAVESEYIYSNGDSLYFLYEC